jgi:predicted regulator of Ras-like GTPase activity (Roadblock/LC7/MglB family)
MVPRDDAIAFLGAEDLAQLDAQLGAFLDATAVLGALLIDRSGRLLTAAGDLHAIDRTAFASLAAADFGASDQLAALLGEREFASLYHHGEQTSMYLADIGGSAILAALFDDRTTLGMVRLRLKTVVPELVAVLARIHRDGHRRAPELDAGWADEAAGEIDRLFGEG